MDVNKKAYTHAQTYPMTDIISFTDIDRTPKQLANIGVAI